MTWRTGFSRRRAGRLTRSGWSWPAWRWGLLPANAPLLVAVDDILLRRSGGKLHGAAWTPPARNWSNGMGPDGKWNRRSSTANTGSGSPTRASAGNGRWSGWCHSPWPPPAWRSSGTPATASPLKTSPLTAPAPLVHHQAGRLGRRHAHRAPPRTPDRQGSHEMLKLWQSSYRPVQNAASNRRSHRST
jgi:hypothetical protein